MTSSTRKAPFTDWNGVMEGNKHSISKHNTPAELFQCQSNQPVCMVRHKQRNIQHIPVQLQIIQGEAEPELDLIRE